MKNLPRLNAYSSEAQRIILVLTALEELGAIQTKQATIDHIKSQGYFAIVLPEDNRPYRANRLTTKEPRWRTSLAWGRKDALDDREWLNYHDEKDCWEINRAGLAFLKLARQRFGSGGLDVRECFLWSPIFKRLMNPGYSPSAADRARPRDLYKDIASERILEDII